MKLPFINTGITFLDTLNAKVMGRVDAAGRFLVNVGSSIAPTVGTTPPVGPNNGDLWYDSTLDAKTLYAYDSDQALWLSVAEIPLESGHDSVDGAFNRLSGIAVPAAGSGWEMPRDGMIQRVAINAQGGNLTKSMAVQINGVITNTFVLVAGEFTNNQVNQQFAAGDELITGALAAGAAVTDVAMTLYIRWRA